MCCLHYSGLLCCGLQFRVYFRVVLICVLVLCLVCCYFDVFVFGCDVIGVLFFIGLGFRMLVVACCFAFSFDCCGVWYCVGCLLC